MLQVTPEQLAQIDGIIDETVAEALEVQRKEYELQAESERRKTAAARQGIERSRNFWRNTAITSCAVLAAGICTELLIYRRNQ
jgi:anti-sigma-K factor RskA